MTTFIREIEYHRLDLGPASLASIGGSANHFFYPSVRRADNQVKLIESEDRLFKPPICLQIKSNGHTKYLLICASRSTLYTYRSD